MNTSVNDSPDTAVAAPAVAPVAASVAADGPIRVLVNGEARHVAAGTTLEVVVTALSAAPSGVAAAVNEAVVPRGEWPATRLGDGDRVEILTAVQGG
ncbi:sulfur carrier protein ThiS [Streptomyces sp. Tu 2975]|uniref:sulfur carrier protein ThiS n=1 Tax=Streptomyces sp. Tu 2975 TaxID=2676871 RepID=UPI00135CBBE9|nr:sulfur carrier protein ThiS [Streptomyces sp. Tu 2975]QIP86919.1 sulfur carrier protein ThiS [Streptomyces sp. Tu 2975]